jgi:hypothetical protein
LIRISVGVFSELLRLFRDALLIKEVSLMIDLNWRFLFILLLGSAVGVMFAIDRSDSQELLGLLSGTAIGALLVYGCECWPKR